MTMAVLKVVPNVAKADSNNDPRDLRTFTEGELLDAVLRRDNRAWAELMRRFDPMLRTVVRRRLARALPTMLPSDAIDDVMGAFYLDLLERDMNKLRLWGNGPRRAKLSTWLTMIVCQIALDHLRSAHSRKRLPGKLRREYGSPDLDPNRGGAWIGEERSAGDGATRRRRTKTVEDELRELQTQYRPVPVA